LFGNRGQCMEKKEDCCFAVQALKRLLKDENLVRVFWRLSEFESRLCQQMILGTTHTPETAAIMCKLDMDTILDPRASFLSNLLEFSDDHTTEVEDLKSDAKLSAMCVYRLLCDDVQSIVMHSMHLNTFHLELGIFVRQIVKFRENFSLSRGHVFICHLLDHNPERQIPLLDNANKKALERCLRIRRAREKKSYGQFFIIIMTPNTTRNEYDYRLVTSCNNQYTLQDWLGMTAAAELTEEKKKIFGNCAYRDTMNFEKFKGVIRDLTIILSSDTLTVRCKQKFP